MRAQAVQTQHGAGDAARANLQTILDNLTAGVMVLDAKGRISRVQSRRHPHSAGATGGVRRPAPG